MNQDKKALFVDIIKLTLSVITGVGMEILCGSAARKLTDKEVSKTGAVCAGIAGAVAGGMISDAADAYIDKTVDGVIDAFGKVRALVKDIRSMKEEK